LQRKLTSRSDVKARSAVLELKKRHVERLTRLPTKCLATACWAFIVVKTPRLETAPLLDFAPLHAANMQSCQQDINRLVEQSSRLFGWRHPSRIRSQTGLRQRRL
jgi:hypothetical protein